MSAFEALFTFYGLLLGLAVANVTSGFADIYRRKARLRVGRTMPLLAVLILVSVVQQWLSLWNAQSLMPLNWATMLTCLGMALPYIFLSGIMIPEADDMVALDDHYAEHRRTILAALLVPLATSLATNLIGGIVDGRRAGEITLGLLIYIAPRMAIVLAMLAWPYRHVQRAGLALLIAVTCFFMVY